MWTHGFPCGCSISGNMHAADWEPWFVTPCDFHRPFLKGQIKDLALALLAVAEAHPMPEVTDRER